MNPPAPLAQTCPVCHEPILPTYYFCPNCGIRLAFAQLPTSVSAQIKLYAFSIILPFICFIFVTRWKGIKYFRSSDEKTQSIGLIACALIILSTVCLIYFSIIWTREATNAAVSSVNSSMNQDLGL